jgi:hypothetical protein
LLCKVKFQNCLCCIHLYICNDTFYCYV